MEEQTGIIKGFFRLVMISFFFAILVMSLFGWIRGGTISDTSVAFGIGAEGLSYQTIFKVLLLSAVNSGISLSVNVAKIFTKVMLLWKMAFIMFSCLAATAIMAAAFRWIQRDSLSTWLWFVSTFITTFILAAIITIIKVKREEKKYNDLLSNYKKEHGKND